ncbi:MAG: amidohydrolase [Bacteroidetes bacterium HGW-Bacteroidetes-13]|nr:MAG: amidohydrolase [Bacteroidetes bacterium HGW-Bacteroidetes-13]
MKKIFALSAVFICLTSCQTPKENIDLLVVNADIYTVDSTFSKSEALAVHQGKIVGIGKKVDLLEKYNAKKTIDAEGRVLLPGLIDAHAHFYGLGVDQQQADLVGTKNLEEVLARLVAFHKEKKPSFLLGRGWDQNDWDVKEFPTKESLDKFFPDTPVAITRIDGHAILANSTALKLAGITGKTKISGGEVILKNGEPTGILVDAPMRLIQKIIPVFSRKQQIQALLDAQEICFRNGLTTISDAGLDRNVIELIDSLQQTGDLKIKIYAMVSNNPENLDYYLNKGIVKTDRLNVRSIKVYADGALGSRGACLHEAYSDQAGHFGAMITTKAELTALAKRIAASNYQMNTHAIGDSANTTVLKAYAEALQDKPDRRWRVEHAQVVRIQDFDYFSGNIIPSIQPTHATSDMYWAEDRLGADRIKGAYAFKTLLQKSGIVALGTDFPVEQVNPMLTFYAAVSRQDTRNFPENGFQPAQKLSREETLKGMTIWAAYANFEEKEKGSLEVGKSADFVILNQNIMTIDVHEIPNTNVDITIVSGEIVKK